MITLSAGLGSWLPRDDSKGIKWLPCPLHFCPTPRTGLDERGTAVTGQEGALATLSSGWQSPPRTLHLQLKMPPCHRMGLL